MVLLEVTAGPDQYFWYGLAVASTTLLIGVLIWIGNNTRDILRKLVAQMADHETRITVIEKGREYKHERK
jgi:hypothetical protein